MESIKSNKNQFRDQINQLTDPANGKFSVHSLSGKQVADSLNVDIVKGLSNEEANRRLLRDGANKIAQKNKRTVWHLVRDQFSSIVVWLLAFAALVALLTGNQLEALAILVVLLLNAAIGFLIEWKAGRALDALRKATRTTARVRRDGHEQIIDAENLVVGDILILSAGDRVPANARILYSANLRADESTLTGESVSVEKYSAAVEINAPLAERRPMLYLGTIVVAGNASAVVAATGQNTELGRIGQLVAESDEGQTPLQIRLGDLGKKLVYIVLGIALIVFLAGIFRGDDIWLMLEVSISLAVAAVPEGLPAVTTLILALGVLRMARRNAIVRRLAAVETLGSSTLICTDKTGTLTENRMIVQEYRLANDRNIEISKGKKFDSEGKTQVYSQDEVFQRLLRISILCNEASFDPQGEDDQMQFIGDPTETALLVAVQQFGLDIGHERSNYKQLHEAPFDSTTKRMITVLQDRKDNSFAVMKGAPAVVLNNCSTFVSSDGQTVSLNSEFREKFLEINRKMADRALRVLGFAVKNLDGKIDFETED